MKKIFLCIVCILLIASLTGCQSSATGAVIAESENLPTQEISNPVEKMNMPAGTNHKEQCY